MLRGVTVNIEQGEKVAFIGANGEGKSTCIKLIAGARARGSLLGCGA